KTNRPLIVLDGMVDVDAAREFLRTCAAGIPAIVASDQFAPGPWTPLALTPLGEDDSQALLRAYANLAPEEYAADVAGLSKFIGGVPLAIELAGRLIVADELTPAELLTQLPSSTGQDGLQMMLILVFRRLTPPVQSILVVLAAMFTGSATAELMSDLANAPAPAFVPLMRQLIARGFARERIVYGQFAYTLHEAVQLYARRWLENYQRLTGTENRALQSILAYVDRHAHATRSDQERLAAEIENIVGAAAYAIEVGQGSAVRRLIEDIEGRAGDFVTERHFEIEAGQLNKLATLLAPSTPDAPPPQALGLPDLTAVQAQGQPQAPVPPAAEPLPQLAEPPAEPAPVQAQVRPEIPSAAVPSEPLVSAPPITSESLQERLATARAANDRHAEATILHALAKYYVDQGDTAQARDYYKQAYDAYSTGEDFDGVQIALDELLIISAPTDQTDDTLLYVRRSIELSEKTGGDLAQKGRLLTRQGELQLARGDTSAAIVSYHNAIAALKDTNDAGTRGLAQSRLGEAYAKNGQYADSIASLEIAADLFQKEHYPGFEIRVLSSIGDVYMQLKQFSKAEDYHRRAHRIAVDQLDQAGEASQLAKLGRLRELQGDLPGAADCYARALYSVYVLGKSDLQAQYAFELGRVLVDDPRTLTRAIALLTESDSLVPNDETKRLLNRSHKRLERLQAANIAVATAGGSNREYVTAVADRAMAIA
ncbi:MAG TPA: tetratricopeptide repeat protein, partial [Aggregatilineales bacterium]|nr:tetratricopeptide repeat protein [Aggregatilineales bacterium]